MPRALARVAMLLAVAAAWPAEAQDAMLRFEERWIGEERTGAPLVIALHPWGSSGRSMLRLMERVGFDRPVRVIAPDGPFPYGSGRAWLSRTISEHDDDALAREASDAAARVAALVRAQRRASEPVVVTGISQGAVVAYTLAARSPELVDAVVPVSGLLPEHVTPSPSRARIVALHGERDPFVPFERARGGVERLRRAGYDVELRGLAHGHDVRGPLRAALYAALRAEVSALR